MSKTYQIFYSGCVDFKIALTQIAGENDGWMVCERLKGDAGWITTYETIGMNGIVAEEIVRDNNVGVIHILITDDVARVVASLDDPYESGNNGEYYAQTIPMLALIDGAGRRAYIPMGYEIPSFYDQD